MKIRVAHDFVCPWCWVGLFQAKRMQQEFGVEIEWIAVEQYPATMPFEPPTIKPDPEVIPPVPSRFSLMLKAEGMTLPLVPKIPGVRTFNAHQAVEYAKTEGCQDALVEAIYRGFWEEGKDINKVDVLVALANGIVKDIEAMKTAMATDQFGDKVIDFDEEANRAGIYNIPTFSIGDKRLAEQPYVVLQKALIDALEKEPEVTHYGDISYANPHPNRPLTFVNMVATIDGKIVTGDRNESVSDLGSDVDHFLMRRLEAKADAVLVGANSLRASGNNWNPESHARIVVTKSGNVPWESKFLTNGNPIVLTTEESNIPDRKGVLIIRAGKSDLDWKLALEEIHKLGIEIVNVLGGSKINGQLFKLELIDEIFLTIAPKIKLGDHTPTIAGGNPLARSDVQKFRLVSNKTIGDEIFLRYQK